MPDKADYDQPLKFSLISDPKGFLDIFLPELKHQETLSSELPEIPRQADEAWKVELPDGTPGLLHIELQTNPDQDMGLRLAEYAIRLWRHHRLPIHSLVIWLRPAKTLPPSPFGWYWNQQEAMRYQFESLRLWEHQPEEVLETTAYAIWPLAAAMGATVTLEAQIALVERIDRTPLGFERRGELAAITGAIAGLRLPEQERRTLSRRIKAMFGDILRESPFLEDLIEELRPEIRAEGRAEGEREMAHRMAKRALESKFGALGADLLAALETASPETLEDIVAHISADTLVQTRARLGLQ